MNRTLAEKLLALAPQALPAAIREAYARRASQLGRERELAITRSLRERIEQELAGIRNARDFLLGQSSQPVDPDSLDELPLTSPPQGPVGAPRTPSPFSTTGNARVLDRYDLGEKLGSGGMGEVFAAFDRLTSQPVAIKFISERISSRTDSLQRFLSEARLSCRLSHPNIVRTFDVHEAAGRYFITMELLEGHTLRQHIATRIAAGHAFERAELSRILHQICAALAYAHKDLVHRDIKPENVWRCADGTIKLMDFGVALDVASADLAEASAALGTEGYRAPEQTTGADPVDQRADQYSVACLAVEMLAAPAPCRPAQLRTDRIARGDPVRPVLERALSGRVGDRFDTILEFESALRNALLRARWRRYTPWLAALAFAIALLIGAGMYSPQANSPAEVAAGDPASTLAPALQAHARLSEARALLAAIDTLVEQSREELERMRTEFARSQSGSAATGTAIDALVTDAHRQNLEDAELLAARARSWALMGDERIAVEGHLGAAEAAVERENWDEAATQAKQALARLSSSRAQLVAARNELAALRELSARIETLQARPGPLALTVAADKLRQDLAEVRSTVASGDLDQARRLRDALDTRVQAQTESLESELRGHWQTQAEAALRVGDRRRAQAAIAALESGAGNADVVAVLRNKLAVLERRAGAAAAEQRARELEEQELQREQENYRPQRGSGR